MCTELNQILEVSGPHYTRQADFFQLVLYYKIRSTTCMSLNVPNQDQLTY